MTTSSFPGAIIIEGHVQGLSNTRSLGEAGIPVYVVDKTNCIARYSKYCKKFFRCPDFINDEFSDFLISLAQKEPIKDWVLIPSNDHAVFTLSKHKTNLEKYYKIITPEISTIENIYDKLRLLKIAADELIAFPTTHTFLKADERIPPDLVFPVLTKGRNGLSFYKFFKRKAFLAKNEAELHLQLEEISAKSTLADTFTQEVIPYDNKNKTVSFTAFCVSGEIKTCWMGMKLREHPIRFGTGTFAKSIYIQECFNSSVPLLRALHYTGVCEVEYIFDQRDGVYKLIEINPRTWLWVGLAKACGVDFAKMIYQFMNGLDMVYPTEYKKDIYWINPISDTFFSMIALFKRKLSFSEYFKSLCTTSKVNALLSGDDYKPFFAYLFNLFSFTRKR